MPIPDELFQEAYESLLENELKIKSGEIKLAESDDPLFFAVQTGDVQAVIGLLKRGSDVNVRDEDGKTPLMLALGINGWCSPSVCRDILEALLSAGADCAAQDSDGCTCLHHACMARNRFGAQLVIEAGCDLDAADLDGRTALMYACLSDRLLAPFLVGDLLKHGANPMAETEDGRSIWDFAQDSTTALILLNQSDQSHRYCNGDTPLMRICRRFDLDLVKWALDNGADIGARNKEGETAFMIACKPALHPDAFLNQLALINFLLERGADDDHSAGKGRPVLAWIDEAHGLLGAITEGDHDEVRTFLEQGVPTWVANENGTPLMIAAGNGDVRSIKMLIAAGAELDLTSYILCKSALITACIHGHSEAVKILLDEGADVNWCVTDTRCRLLTNPLIVASGAGHLNVVTLLLKAGALVDIQGFRYCGYEDRFTPLSRAAANGHVEVVDALLAEGCDVNLCNPLREAVEAGSIEVVESLLVCGANVNSWSGFGESAATPLMIAANHGNDRMVECLLKHGADPAVTTGYGESALSMDRDRNYSTILEVPRQAATVTEGTTD
jgi:uncharacterized protein